MTFRLSLGVCAALVRCRRFYNRLGGRNHIDYAFVYTVTVHANVTIQSPQQSNVHSGVGGGSVAEPLVDMSRLLAALTTPDRRIAIPGFYDSVRSLTREEQTCYDEVISRTSPYVVQSAFSSILHLKLMPHI